MMKRTLNDNYLMKNPEIFNMVQFAVPMYTTLMCMLLFLRMFYRNESAITRKNLKWGIFAYALSVCIWLSLTLYIAFPKVYNSLSPVVLFLFMFVHVIYYRFIFELTRINNAEKFSQIHYFFPATAFLVMVIWYYFMPTDIQLRLMGPETINKLCFYFIYDIIYAILGLRRTIRFQKVIINYFSDEHRISFVWLYQFLCIMIITVPMMVISIVVSNYLILALGISIFPIVTTMLKEIILAHNILVGNYIIIKSDPYETTKEGLQHTIPKSIQQQDIHNLETYMCYKKPYLNPHLKITDITADLKTNRTYLSLLINRTFEMNFNRYVNRYRLRELERLKNDPACAGWSEMDLIAMAGFSDYRGYKRVKQREEIEI